MEISVLPCEEIPLERDKDVQKDLYLVSMLGSVVVKVEGVKFMSK